MTGISGILLIVALVLVSGVIAYVGDIVGRRMGRKRLSLFGLRPRHTAIVISVFAGMLITIMTLVVAMTLSRDVKDGFLRVVEMRKRQAEMAERIEQINSSMHELEQQRENAQEELQQRQQELDEAKELLEAANADLESTQEELAKASDALKRAEGAVRRLGSTWLELARKKDDLQRDIEDLRAQAAGNITLERFTPIVLGAGQPLDWELVEGGRSIEAIRSDLDTFVSRLHEQAISVGARPLPESDEVVIIRKPVRDPQADTVVWFGEEEVLNAIAERIQQNSGGVIVRAFSVFNTHPGEPVRVDFELFRNHLVFHRGDVLAHALVDGTLSEPEIMSALLTLLREQVSTKARAHNVMPRPNPSRPESPGSDQGTVGDIGIKELFDAIGRLRSMQGMARITAIAAADTWTIGPLEVNLIVSSASGVASQPAHSRAPSE